MKLTPGYILKGKRMFMNELRFLLREHEGEYAVYHDGKRVGVWPDLDSAYDNGCKIARTSELFIPRINRELFKNPDGEPIILGWPSRLNSDGSISAMF